MFVVQIQYSHADWVHYVLPNHILLRQLQPPMRNVQGQVPIKIDKRWMSIYFDEIVSKIDDKLIYDGNLSS